jgi:tetratricopeptide (TPR) repeat protein
MAERIEEQELDVPDPLDQANPAAVALAMGRAGKGGGKSLDAKAEAFLEEQTRLARLQQEHLHEQRDLVLLHLVVRRWKDRASLVLQALGAVIGVAVLIGLGTMVWQAHEDHGAVIQPFSVPPDLAARGLTGQVAAAKIMDKLAEMQAQTGSARAPSSFANNWGEDIKVDIPETGVSINDLYRLMRRWLGHQTVISGEIVRSAGGLSITARAGEEAGATFEAPEAELDTLFKQAAEAVYQRTQPYRYGALLMISGDPENARPVLESLAADGDEVDRKWAAVGLANIGLYSGDLQAAMRGYHEVERRWPDFVMGPLDVMGGAGLLDQEEEWLAAARKTAAMIPGGHNPQITEVAARAMAADSAAVIAELQGDWQTGARQEAQMSEMADYGGSRLGGQMSEMGDLAFGHQPGAAAALIARARPPAGVPDFFVQSFNANLAEARLFADVERQDWAAAKADAREAQQLASQSKDKQLPYAIHRQVEPWLAYAEAMSGDRADADALIASTPLDCDTCVRLRGRVAAAEGNWKAAERWYAQATRQAPDIPYAYVDWGRMLLARGDVAGAIAKAQIAYAKGPHYPDALELWGEALMKTGDPKGAAGKFSEAAKYAPAWDRNNQLLQQAQAKAGGHG